MRSESVQIDKIWSFEVANFFNLAFRKTRPVTGRSLRIFKLFTQKGFEILVKTKS